MGQWAKLMPCQGEDLAHTPESMESQTWQLMSVIQSSFSKMGEVCRQAVDKRPCIKVEGGD